MKATSISIEAASSPRENSLVAALRSPATAIATAFLLRLIFLYASRQAGAEFISVGQEAGNIAWAMALGRGFSSPLIGMQGPTAWVAPVYPILLAAGFKLVRMNPYHVVVFGQVLNALFSALTCWPIYLAARKVFGQGIALASCWAWTLLPTAILFPLEWLWDQSLSALLLTALICATLYLPDAWRAERPTDAGVIERERNGATWVWRQWLPWILYGVGWAFALLTNPATGLLLPFFAGWLAWQHHKRGVRWKARVGMALLACALGILPWMVRNYAAFGTLVPIKSNFGLEFWLGNNPDVKIIWTWWRSPASDSAEMSALKEAGEITYMQQKQKEALNFIWTHPGTFLDSCFDRFVDTWTGIWDERTDPWIVALHAGSDYAAFCSIFSLLALLGLLLARRANGFQIFPLSAALLVFPATYYITHSALRYRHPIDPVMTILAVYALACLYARIASTEEADQPRAIRSRGEPGGYKSKNRKADSSLRSE